MLPYQYILIIGCGRLGSVLANELSSLGSNVVVVDRDEDAFNGLSTEFSGFTVTGDAAEMAVLRSARIDEADCLLAVTRHDNVNLMVAQVASTIFNVSRVIARVTDPARERVFRQFGIETVCPTGLMASALLGALQDQPREGAP